MPLRYCLLPREHKSLNKRSKIGISWCSRIKTVCIFVKHAKSSCERPIIEIFHILCQKRTSVPKSSNWQCCFSLPFSTKKVSHSHSWNFIWQSFIINKKTENWFFKIHNSFLRLAVLTAKGDENDLLDKQLLCNKFEISVTPLWCSEAVIHPQPVKSH